MALAAPKDPSSRRYVPLSSLIDTHLDTASEGNGDEFGAFGATRPPFIQADAFLSRASRHPGDHRQRPPIIGIGRDRRISAIKGDSISRRDRLPPDPFAQWKAGNHPLHPLPAQSRRYAVGAAVLQYPRRNFREAPIGMRCGTVTRHWAPATFTFDGTRFQGKLGIEHHKATKDIISGRVSLGKEVYSVLRRHRIDVEGVIALISGECAEFDRFFDGPINFDTIEGILRSHEYVQRTYTMPKPDQVMEAAIRRDSRKDRDLVDRFWKYKNWVYRHIINSRDGILSDLACQFYLRRNLDDVDVDCYFLTEPNFFRRLPCLRALLASHEFESNVLRLIDEPIRYRNRNYYIDPAGDFFARCDDARYKHSRNIQVLSLKDEATPLSAEPVHGPQEALFHDDPL